MLHKNDTLFNVAQRLGGSIGIPLLVTFFGVREQVRVEQALHLLGLPVGAIRQSSTMLSHLPASMRDQIARAAVTGFHDTIWLLVLLSAVGIIAALLLRDRRSEAPMTEVRVAETSLMEEHAPV